MPSYLEMCDLIINKLKMHPTGVPALKIKSLVLGSVWTSSYRNLETSLVTVDLGNLALCSLFHLLHFYCCEQSLKRLLDHHSIHPSHPPIFFAHLVLFNILLILITIYNYLKYFSHHFYIP